MQEGEREAEVALVAERLTAAHEESVRRLEESLVAYTRVQDHDHFQVCVYLSVCLYLQNYPFHWIQAMTALLITLIAGRGFGRVSGRSWVTVGRSRITT